MSTYNRCDNLQVFSCEGGVGKPHQFSRVGASIFRTPLQQFPKMDAPMPDEQAKSTNTALTGQDSHVATQGRLGQLSLHSSWVPIHL